MSTNYGSSDYSDTARLEETRSLLTRAVQTIDHMSDSSQHPATSRDVATTSSRVQHMHAPSQYTTTSASNLRTPPTNQHRGGSMWMFRERRSQPVDIPATCSSEPTTASAPSRKYQGRSSYQRERLNLFRPKPYARAGARGQKGSKKKIAMWEHDFCCLATTTQDTPPTPLQKAQLFQAGLGMKTLRFLDSSDAGFFHEDILEAFPKLEDAGGYELMRTAERNNRVLYVIPVPSSGYSVVFLKSIVGQAKV